MTENDSDQSAQNTSNQQSTSDSGGGGGGEQQAQPTQAKPERPSFPANTLLTEASERAARQTQTKKTDTNNE